MSFCHSIDQSTTRYSSILLHEIELLFHFYIALATPRFAAQTCGTEGVPYLSAFQIPQLNKS